MSYLANGSPFGSPVSLFTPLAQPSAGHAGHTGRLGSTFATSVMRSGTMPPPTQGKHSLQPLHATMAG